MLYKVRDFVNVNILKSIYYALFGFHINMLASYGNKTALQLTVSTFSRKRHLELSTLKSLIITPLLHFITLKLSKLQTKSRLRTDFLKTNIPIKLCLQFLLIGLHFHQCVTIIEHHLPTKETIKSLVPKQHHIKKKMLLFIWL